MKKFKIAALCGALLLMAGTAVGCGAGDAASSDVNSAISSAAVSSSTTSSTQNSAVNSTNAGTNTGSSQSKETISAGTLTDAYGIRTGETGIAMGMKSGEVEASLSAHNINYVILANGGIKTIDTTYTIDDTGLQKIESSGAAYTTQKGMKIGDTVQTVKDLYGANYTETTTDSGAPLYRYIHGPVAFEITLSSDGSKVTAVATYT